MSDQLHYTHIIASRSRVLYVGMTNNRARRVREHKQREGNSFTARYNVTRLVWYRSFPRPQDAITAEKTIKGWVRRKKVAMIEQEDPEWNDLGPAAMEDGQCDYMRLPTCANSHSEDASRPKNLLG
jgi:putative endonuclease